MNFFHALTDFDQGLGHILSIMDMYSIQSIYSISYASRILL